MKFRTTTTLKLALLDNGSLEVTQESMTESSRASPLRVTRFPFTFTEEETKALREFLNDATPTTA